jgi:TolB-like protein/DNA-binding winged helix-turn-helix (wHTH) protein
VVYSRTRVPSVADPVQSRTLIHFGAFEVDLSSGELRKNGVKVRLPDQSFQVLAMLTENPGKVVTRDELRKKLWPGDTFVDFDDGLNSAVLRLRNALGDSAGKPRFVETLPRRGYRFLAPLNGATAETQASPAVMVATPGPAVLRRRPGKLMWQLGFAAATLVAVLGALIALNVGGIRQRFFPVPQIHSVAVLSLENVSGDPNQEYFADGLTDALTTELAQVGSLRVISRTSAIRYKGQRKPLAQIASELHVDAVVEGTVRRDGERVWMTTQLIDTARDRHLWARSYEREVRDFPALQAEVVRDLVYALGIRLNPNEEARLARSSTIGSEAYDLYLRSGLHFTLENATDNQTAIDLLERAVSLDPDFAPAYARLSNAYRIRASVLSQQDKVWEEKALAAVQKALALDPNLAEAYVSRGHLLWSLPNHFPHERAADDYHHALALNPNLAEAHHQLAHLYNHVGLLDKGLEEARKAVALDPLNTGARFRTGVNLLYQGKYEESLVTIRDAQRFFPSLWAFQTSYALFQMGRRDEAAARVDEFLAKYPEDIGGLLTSMQAMFAAAAGNDRLAEEKIQRAIKIGEGYQHFHHTTYIIASAYALLNKPEPAMKYLQMTADDGFPCYPLFERDPNLSNLHNDPRYVQFMADLRKQWEHYQATM